MKHIFIYNPAAGSGTAEEILFPEIRQCAAEENLDYEIHRTLNKQEVGSYCRQRSERGEAVRFYACGGDGTICDVANGIAGFDNAELAVYPCGTGNDFVKNFTNRKNFLKIKNLVRGSAMPCDLIKTDTGYVINMVNVGLDSEIAAAVNAHKSGMLKGPALYLAETLKLLMKRKTYHMVYEKDGETLEGDFLLTCVGNGSFCGGGFCTCPKAVLSDGKMDVCMVRPIHETFDLLRLLLKYKKGTHLMDKSAEKYIIYFRASHFALKSLNPVKVAVDGETGNFAGTGFDMVPGSIRLIVPEGSEPARNPGAAE